MLRSGAHRTQRSLTPIAREKLDRRAAVLETRLLPWRPLIESSRDQQRRRENSAAAGHGIRKQTGPVETPLKSGREQAEGAPDRHIAEGEQGAGGCGLTLVALPCQRGDKQDSRRRARQHHCRHHDDPHEEDRRRVAGSPVRRHQHDLAAAHVHLVHMEAGAHQQPDPREGDDGRQAGDDKRPVVAKYAHEH